MDDCVDDYATDVLGGIMDAIKNPLNTSNVCGLMVTNMSNGFRTGFVNPVYNELKILRGNNPNLHYQYLVLRKTGKVMNFLRFFPQYKKHFAQFKEHFNSYVTRLHNLYINIYVLKINKMDDVTDKRDKYHLSKLHFERYLPALRAFKQHVLEQTNGLEDVKSKSEDSNAKPKDSNAKPKITLRDVYNYMDSEGVICPF